jgi:hypothetical protein
MADFNNTPANQGTKKSNPVGMIVTSIILGIGFSYHHVF